MNKQFDLNSFIAGDMGMFKILYQSYVGKIYNYIYSLLPNKEIAQDLTQNTFLHIWNSRENISPTGNLDGYIYAIARNLLFKEIRRMNIFYRYEAQIKEEMEEGIDIQIDENLSRQNIEKQILSLLVELPEARRKIFLMRWSKGLSNKEIAEQLSISEKTVSTQIHRTVSFLKSKLGTIFLVSAIITSIKF